MTENDNDINNISTDNTSKNTMETNTLVPYVKKTIEYYLSYMVSKEEFTISQIATSNTIKEYIALKDMQCLAQILQ